MGLLGIPHHLTIRCYIYIYYVCVCVHVHVCALMLSLSTHACACHSMNVEVRGLVSYVIVAVIKEQEQVNL